MYDFVRAFEGDEAALARLNEYYDRAFSMADLRAEVWRRVYAFRERSSRVPKNSLKLEEARAIVAQDAGFSSWETVLPAIARETPSPGPTGLSPRYVVTFTAAPGAPFRDRKTPGKSLSARVGDLYG